jgi:hypothetical protein
MTEQTETLDLLGHLDQTKNFKALIYGEAGTGKTCSLRTLLNTGQKVRFLAAENNALSGIAAALRLWQTEQKKTGKLDLDPEQFAVMIPTRPKRGIADIIKNQTKFLDLALDKQTTTADPERRKYTRYLEVLKSTSAFVDTTSGKNFGNVEDWGADTTFAVDSLTIICEAIVQGTVGGKLATTQQEWGIMQKTLIEFMRFLTEDLRCNVVLLGHPTKETDQLNGGQKIYPANLGQALNNLLPSYFTEVLYSYRRGKDFLWSTQHNQAVTRQTVLPLSNELQQDFAQFFKGN